MSKPVVTVAKKNSLRRQEEGTLTGTRLEKGTNPHLGDTGQCDYS